MAYNWNEYEVRLCEDSSKECEVTGRDMGGEEYFTCPVADMIAGKAHWTPESQWAKDNNQTYGGYQSVSFKFEGADDKGLHLSTEKWYHQEITLTPESPEWSTGWYSFGSWDYCVRLSLQKINSEK